MFDLAVAFLNSFRRHNPILSLCLIPFDGDCARVAALRDAYAFEIFTDAAILAECDALSAQFHGDVLGHYRKLAIWEGPFDEFIYIDVDTVVLGSLDFVFPLLDRFPILASHSHIDGIVRWVWRKSIREQNELTEVQVAFSANTGFIGSKRGVLSVAGAKAKLSSALQLRHHMVLECKEQSFLNYLIVTSGVKYSSLRVLAHALAAGGTPHRLALEHWAGNRHAMVADGQARARHTATPILLMHWAGEWEPRRWELVLFEFLLRLGLRTEAARPRLRRRMPYRALWQHYRSLEPPVAETP